MLGEQAEALLVGNMCYCGAESLWCPHSGFGGKGILCLGCFGPHSGRLLGFIDWLAGGKYWFPHWSFSS